MRRNVRRIGLEHDRIERQRLRQAAYLQSPLESHRPAEAELETEFDKGERLLLAAVECVRDAAAHRRAAQMLQQGVGRAPHMQDRGQLELARQLQLLGIEKLLAYAVEARHEMVEPDLADRNQPRVTAASSQRITQAQQVAFARTIDIQRVDAERVDEAKRMCQLAHRVEVRHLHGRQHDLRHPRLRGARDHAGAVGFELRRVEVAMGVDPHDAIMPLRAVTGFAHRATVVSIAPFGISMMKKAPLYSRSRGPARDSATSAPAEAAPPPEPTRRQRLRAFAFRHERRLWAASVLLLVLGFGVWTARHAAAPTPMTIEQIDDAIRASLEDKPLPSPAAKAYDAVSPSVVRVVGLMTEGDDGSDDSKLRERGVGSGVVIIDNGTILTNLHVVGGAKRIKVTFFDGHESDAVVLSTQPENDLAVLRAKSIPDDLAAATLRSTSDLLPGDQVVAVGFPFGIGPSVSAGVVSGLKREFRSPEGEQMLTNLIQFDAAANPGNSGGPLVTMDGEVVGIVTAILNPSHQRVFIGIGFAVPIENAAAAAGMPPF